MYPLARKKGLPTSYPGYIMVAMHTSINYHFLFQSIPSWDNRSIVSKPFDRYVIHSGFHSIVKVELNSLNQHEQFFFFSSIDFYCFTSDTYKDNVYIVLDHMESHVN